MKQYISTSRKHHRLLLFFAGWGMDEFPFLQYTPPDSDFMICYDYRTLDFDASLIKPYTKIDVVAWSMGVWAASQVLQELSLPIRKSVAINGTSFPIDDRRGIPPPIFQGTLEGLNQTTLLKFQRRMCMDGSSYARFKATAPQRTVEELREELDAIGKQYRLLPPAHFSWQRAYIGKNDRIFPPVHQQEAWNESTARIESGDEAHYDELLFRKYLEER